MAEFDAERWRGLVEGADCPICTRLTAEEDEGGDLVAELPSGRLLLQDDADFPGYCILLHRRHVTELFHLSEAERAQLVQDVARAAEAIAAVCGPAKINYAILGNEVPHLHCHVIPRYPGDGYWGAPIWSRPADQRALLTPDEFDGLLSRLREAVKR